MPKNPIRIFDKIDPEAITQLQASGYPVGNTFDDPRAILVRSSKIDTDNYPNLLVVARAGVGTNTITVDKATEAGICVLNTPGANANAVAELVFITLGMALRNLTQVQAFTASLPSDQVELEEAMERGKSSFQGKELRGKKLAVIGLGKIGVKVANLGIALGMTVTGYDKSPVAGQMHQLHSAVHLVDDLNEAVKKADVISVHIPLTRETTGLIGHTQMLLMAHGAVLLNFARAGIYDEAAMQTHLQKGHISCYVTDFPNPALLSNSRVICIPHLGASTAEAERACATMAATQLVDYLKFGTVTNSVNFPNMTAYPEADVKCRLAIPHKNVPGIMGAITTLLGANGLNISASHNAHRGEIAYTVCDFDQQIDSPIMDAVSQLEGVIRVRLLSF